MADVAQERQTRAWARVAAGFAATAAVLYSAWLLAPWLNPHHDTTASYVSELAATDQPFSRVFRGFDAAAGLTLAAAVLVLLLRETGRWPVRLRRNGPFVALGLFGLATFVDSRLPLSCARTVDVRCAVEDGLGLLPWTHQLHAVSSTAASSLAIVALAWSLGRAWRPRREGAAPQWLVTPAITLALVHTGALAYTLLEHAGLGLGGLGVAQRLSLTALTLWWVLLFLAWRKGVAVGAS